MSYWEILLKPIIPKNRLKTEGDGTNDQEFHFVFCYFVSMEQTLQRLVNAIEFIERNLDQKLDIHDIAKQAEMSPWYFQRVFRSLTGDSVNRYVQSRRMSLAAARVLKGESLIELALDMQFGGQEAFTRAFKRYFGITPGKYRRVSGQGVKVAMKPRIEGRYLQQIQKGNKAMQPIYCEKNEMKLIGISAPFNGAMAKEANNHNVIPDLWKKFFSLLPCISNRSTDETIGVIYPASSAFDDGSDRLHENLIYFAGVELTSFDKVPLGMEKLTLKGQRYASFGHRGPIDQIDMTLQYIFGSWLPQSGHQILDLPNLEIFPEGYLPMGERSEMNYLVPVVD